MKTILQRAFFIALALVAASCSQQSDWSGPNGLPVSPRAAGDPAIRASLPSLPALHEAAALLSFTQTGSQAILREPGAVDEGSSLRLASSPSALCWGIWGFGYGADATQCTVDFSGVAAAEAYFAISDYSKGAWEIRGPLAGPQQVFSLGDLNYASPGGTIYIAVMAFDGANILVDQLSLSADIGPVQLPVDNSGGYTSMAIVNGNPAIAFYDEGAHDLRYVRAADNFGTAWGATKTPDSTGDTGLWTSLKVVDGFPAIAYYDFTQQRLRYVRALDANGDGWGAPLTVDNSGACGEYCSLEVISGNPAISYYYYDASELRYVRAADTTGAAWGLPVSPDSDGNTGQYSSLEMLYSTFDSYAAIAYRNGGAGELRFVRGDAVGSAWEQPQILDSGSNSGFSNSMALVNGVPAIAYYDSTESSLRYIQAQDPAGTMWSPAQTLDGQLEDAGDYCSLALIGGTPAISYYNGLHGDLRYIAALDINGAAWGESVLLDESSNVIGQDTFLLEVYGVAGISYHDQTNGKVRYMWGF